MPLVDLDTGDVRAYMVSEIEADIASDRLYKGSRLSERGLDGYPDLLIAAADTGDTDSLTAQLQSSGFFRSTYIQNRGTGPVEASVPHTAAATLAQGEFNRFDMRGLAIEAAAQGIEHLLVCRARPLANPGASPLS